MQSIINYSADVQALSVLDKELKDAVALLSEDDWKILSTKTYTQFLQFVSAVDLAEIGCVDVTSPNAITAAETLRKSDPDAVLIIVSDMSVSPVMYIKPSIMASTLIMKPISFAGRERLREAVQLKLQVNNDEQGGQRFCLETKQGKSFFPYNRIVFFEAREKKVFLNTLQEEYPFYSTLDILEGQLPSSFVRCHRGFIINSNMIEQISFGEGLIYMEGGVVVPLSRNNKTKLKSLMEKQQVVL